MSEKANKPNKHYAKVSHPLMEAVAHELFRFETMAQAVSRMQDFRDTYHLSRQQPEQGKVPSIRLWVQDFQVEDAERQDGYCGHFAIITPGAMGDGKFCLTAVKDLTPVAQHPRKKFVQHKHPSWTHPIMQAIKRSKVFDDRETANNVLQQLHEEFPEVTVPGIDKLNVIMYERTKESRRPVKKYVLSVLEVKEGENAGKFTIDAQHNRRARPPKQKKEETRGRFTKMLAERKKRNPIWGAE